MTRAKHPPAISEKLLTIITPVSIKEELLGDLEERFHQRKKDSDGRETAWYWMEALRLLPFLALQWTHSPSFRSNTISMAFAAAALMFVVVWQILVVDQYAWGATASLLDAAPISGKPLFFTIYAGIYLLGVAAIFALTALGAGKARRKYDLELKNMFVVLGIAVSAPSVFYILRPQPLDSVGLRIFLIAVMWGGIAVSSSITRLNHRDAK